MKSFFIILSFISLKTMAQSSVELMCKAQAKETAIQVYNDCYKKNVTEKLQDIQKAYKSEQANMKKKYQNQIDELVGKNPTPKVAPTPITAPLKPQTRQVEKSMAKGVPSTLPQKQHSSTQNLSVQEVTEDQTTVPATDEEPQVVEMPVQN